MVGRSVQVGLKDEVCRPGPRAHLRVRGAGLKEGFAGHPGVLKGPEALSLLDLLSPETAPHPTTGSQPVAVHTQVG